jgi:hypothetical protein
MACVLLAGDEEAREEHRQAVRTRGLEWSSGFRSTKLPEVRFSARLAEGSSEWKLARA